MLSSPVVLAFRLLYPNAVLLDPVVFEVSERSPIAVLYSPVELDKRDV